jgi:hypothetical protein
MTQTVSRRILPLAAAAVASGSALAAARPARACDPEALDAHLSAVCDAALAQARAALTAVLPHATPEERAQAEAALARAGAACNTGDPAEGARLAAGLARLAGHIEGRAGLAPPLAAIG